MARAPNHHTADTAIAPALLAWYDRHARRLPWRIGPKERARGIAPDPYRVWLSEVMLQQTTVAAVKSYFEAFTAAWPTVADLAAAPRDDVMKAWAGLGYYARARNLHACAETVVRDHGGRFPGTAAGLRALPGIGEYTAAAIAAIAYRRAGAGGRRQYRAGHRAPLRHRHAAARGQEDHPRDSGPPDAARRAPATMPRR